MVEKGEYFTMSVKLRWILFFVLSYLICRTNKVGTSTKTHIYKRWRWMVKNVKWVFTTWVACKLNYFAPNIRWHISRKFMRDTDTKTHSFHSLSSSLPVFWTFVSHLHTHTRKTWAHLRYTAQRAGKWSPLSDFTWK